MASTTKTSNLVGPEQYDAVVRIEVFADVYDSKKGWPLLVEPSKVQALHNCHAVRVAPIGVFNVGKSWLLERLCEGRSELKLPSGQDVHTEGLSLKTTYLTKDKTSNACVFLDTAGMNSPVTSVPALGKMLRAAAGDQLRAMETMLQELKRHENFVRHVAFEFAQVYLVVVGQISHRDQLELLQLIEQAEQTLKGSKKEIIVVHNLRNLTAKQFDEKMVDQLTGEQDGPTYLESMERVFRMRRRMTDLTLDGTVRGTIPELWGAFGAAAARVQMRHVFLTKHMVDEPSCKNPLVFEHIRQVILNHVPPPLGNVLQDLALIASECAKNMVRLPGDQIEIRYDAMAQVPAEEAAGAPRRDRLVGGRVKADLRTQKESALKSTQNDAAVVAAKDKADAAQVALEQATADTKVHAAREVKAAEEALLEAEVGASARIRLPPLQAADLEPLEAAVVCRPVTLGATMSSSTGSQHVKYNASRVRAYFMGMPYWLTMTHMTLPGLAAGELKNVRDQLQWQYGTEEAGLFTMPNPAKAGEETLVIKFKTRIQSVPVKQIASLNKSGQPRADPGRAFVGGAISVSADAVPVVVESGTRPFASEGSYASDEAAGFAALTVSIVTMVGDCETDSAIPVSVHYGRGVLTVGVLCRLSEAESSDPGRAEWLSGELPTTEAASWTANAHGTDDDTGPA